MLSVNKYFKGLASFLKFVFPSEKKQLVQMVSQSDPSCTELNQLYAFYIFKYLWWFRLMMTNYAMLTGCHTVMLPVKRFPINDLLFCLSDIVGSITARWDFNVHTSFLLVLTTPMWSVTSVFRRKIVSTHQFSDVALTLKPSKNSHTSPD